MKKLVTICFAFSYLILGAQPHSLNEKKLLEFDSNKDEFSFIVGGHFYGSSTNISGFPAPSILASIDTLNSSGASFLLSLGDLFMNIKTDIPFYKRSLLSKLNFPIFNSVGNHDVDRTGTYQNEFGTTYYSFTYQKNKFIILDSEINDGSIYGKQLQFFEKEIQVKKDEIQNVFIASHRTLWAENEKELNGVFKNNTQSVLGINFETEIKPLLKNIESPVYWFSGSLGTAPASFFYHEMTPKLHYIATGVRSLKRDALLKVNVINGEVSLKPISLTNESLLPIESYNVEMWRGHSPSRPFNLKLVPLYVLSALKHRFFWYGILVTNLIIFGMRLILRSRTNG